MALTIILAIVGAAVAAAYGLWGLHIGQRRGRNPVPFFIIPFVLGLVGVVIMVATPGTQGALLVLLTIAFGLVGVVITLFIPPTSQSAEWRRPAVCPHCGQVNRITRKSTGYECRRCHTWSPVPPEDLPPGAPPVVAAPTRTVAPDDPDLVLEVSDLNVKFGSVHAVRGVSYRLRRGETLGIVGESGSGKSVTSLAVMGLLPKNATTTGQARFRGVELLEGSDKELSEVRGKRIAMIFQDPMTSLDPVYKVGAQISETLKVHNPNMSGRQRRARTLELLNIVGIPNAAERVDSYPHEFSGGMRQRVVIAIAMANNPDVIIADEPTTALDVTVQATVLEAIKAAQKETGAALILITHDLGVIAGMADRVLVMYAGKAVEVGSVDDVFYRPRMPYTVGLLNSLPRMDTNEKLRLTPIVGSPPSLQHLPAGCPFSPRCPMHIPECSEAEPPLIDVDGHQKHVAACIRADELRGQDRYEAGEIFETTSADTLLPSDVSGDAELTEPRADEEVEDAERRRLEDLGTPSLIKTPDNPGRNPDDGGTAR
jgi:peptide/nickel transport system ATP-binding protein